MPVSKNTLFLAQVQKTCLQDAQLGRETIEEHQLSEQPEEVLGAGGVQQRGQGDQDVHQGFGPKLSLSGFRR